MFLKDPYTGEPSLAFTMYVMECEGELATDEKEEEPEEDVQEN